ncbi:MAG: hypothetical protein ACOCU6_00325 [Nanoarchaeota archaeon]
MRYETILTSGSLDRIKRMQSPSQFGTSDQDNFLNLLSSLDYVDENGISTYLSVICPQQKYTRGNYRLLQNSTSLQPKIAAYFDYPISESSLYLAFNKIHYFNRLLNFLSYEDHNSISHVVNMRTTPQTESGYMTVRLDFIDSDQGDWSEVSFQTLRYVHEKIYSTESLFDVVDVEEITNKNILFPHDVEFIL